MEQVLGEKWPWGPCNGGDQAQDVHQEDDVQIGKTVAGAFSHFHLASSRTAGPAKHTKTSPATLLRWAPHPTSQAGHKRGPEQQYLPSQAY